MIGRLFSRLVPQGDAPTPSPPVEVPTLKVPALPVHARWTWTARGGWSVATGYTVQIVDHTGHALVREVPARGIGRTAPEPLIAELTAAIALHQGIPGVVVLTNSHAWHSPIARTYCRALGIELRHVPGPVAVVQAS